VGLFDEDKSAERLPVSVITGFLGSGKTTLLNRLLRHAGMGDSAVIINEFGEIALDHLLVERIEGEVAVMASGCVCCSLRSDLEATIRDLLVRRDRGAVPPFARVLVETTGLADPAPIVQLLLNNPLVSHYVRLDTVVTTIDAAHGARQLDEHAEAVKQVALADRLLLTKTDLAEPASIEALRRRLAALNPAAPATVVSHGDIQPDMLFGAALFDPASKTPDVRRWLAEDAYRSREDGDVPGGGHAGHRHDHDHDRHASDIAAFCLSFVEPFEWDVLSRWLWHVRQSVGDDLLRVKGILNLREEDRPVAIHGVHHIFHPPVILQAWPDDDRRSRIVFITRGISQAELEASLQNYIMARA
jgi:G3E family GTPase